MLQKFTYKNITWIDLESPTDTEAQMLVDEYGIHPLVASELLSPTLRARVEAHADYAYLIFHFPMIVHGHHSAPEEEIDFIVGKNFIVTAHYGVSASLVDFAKLFAVSAELEKVLSAIDGDGKPSAGLLFYSILHRLYDHSMDELDQLELSLSASEDRVFHGEEHEMVRELSKASRQLINFKKSLQPQEDVFVAFEHEVHRLFGEEFVPHYRTLVGEYDRIMSALENNIAILDELRKTNDSLLNTKMSDVMKKLTVMAFITFPLSLVGTLFGMNLEFLPFAGNPDAFWIILGIMATVGVFFIVYFTHKKWF